MSNKSTTKYQGVTDTSQNFMNFFDNLSKSNFSQNTKGTMTGTADTTQHGEGTSDMTSKGTTEGKTTGETTTANTYGFMGDTDTADITAYREALNKQNEADPSIKYGAAAAMRSAKNRYAGPFGMGAGSSAATRQAMFKSEEGGIREQEGQNLVKDAFNRRQQQLGGMATLAGLTKRSLVQTGGTSTSTGTQSGTTTGTQTGKTTSDMTGSTKTAQNTDQTTVGTSESESAGVGGGSQTGHQAESGSQTTSTPMWGQLLGGAAQVGAAAATKGA